MKLFALSLALLSIGITQAQVTVMEEGFTTGIPVTWTIVDNDGRTPDDDVSEYTEAWIKKSNLDDNTDTVASSTSFFSPVGQADRWLISPAITLGAYGNELTWDALSYDASFPDSYKVMISKTGTNLTDFTDTAAIIIQENASWTSRSADLSDLLLDNETIHVAFINNTFDGFKLYLDNVKVSKDDPAGLLVNKLTKVSFQSTSSDRINVVAEFNVDKIELVSISGAVLLQTSQKHFNRPENRGVYFVRIYSDSEVVVKKIAF